MHGSSGSETLDDMAAADATREAFVALVEQHRGVIHKVARAYCWSADDRDDLVQDILAQLWRAYPGYDPARPYTTWMYRVALNVAISWLRTHAPRQRATVPLEPGLHDVAGGGLDPVADERLRALLTAIRELESLDRALVLLYLDDHSHRDIAAVLGLSETNAATKILYLDTSSLVKRYVAESDSEPVRQLAASADIVATAAIAHPGARAAGKARVWSSCFDDLRSIPLRDHR